MKLQLTKRLGFLLLGIWLIASGLAGFGLGFPGMAQILAVLAIAAGALILVDR